MILKPPSRAPYKHSSRKIQELKMDAADKSGGCQDHHHKHPEQGQRGQGGRDEPAHNTEEHNNHQKADHAACLQRSTQWTAQLLRL